MKSSIDSIHQRLCELARSQAALDADIARALLDAYLHAVHVALGYPSFRQYAASVFGWTERQAEERMRVVLALRALPSLSESLANGSLGWTKVRELTRVATPQTELEWIAAASSKTVRDVEKLVSGRAPGARPADATPPDAERRRISLELSASSYAQWLAIRRMLTAELSGFVDDDALVRALAAKVLAKSAAEHSEGRSPYQIALRVCERCSHAEAMAGSETVTVEPAAVEAAKCDAQLVGKGRATQTIAPRVRREVLLRHGKRCAAPGCRNSAFLHLHHVRPRAEGGTHDPELLCPLCSSHHGHVHDGRLVIRGSYSSGFVFEHADGTPYGDQSASPAKAALMQTALGFLTAMGYRSTEAQKLLDVASPHVGAEASVEEVVLAALRRADVPGANMVREPQVTYERLCPAA